VVDLTTCYRKTASIVGRRIEDEVILVPIGRNVGDLQNIYTLNEVGSYIWDSIDGGKTLNSIVDQVLQEFEVDRGQAETDVLEFARQLEEVGGIVAGGVAQTTASGS